MKRSFKFLSRLSGAVLLAALVLPPTGARADEHTDKQASEQGGVAAYRAGDYKTALRAFTKLAEAGNANAQFNLAVLYLSGRGVKRDVAKAVDWHRKAARQRLTSAQHGLGVFYYQGMGVKRDYAEALKWFRRAAAKGFAESEFNIGVMYFNRQGVKRDDVEVVKWVTLAAARKFPPAQYRMGQMYEQGVIFIEDRQAALHWYRLAEANGSKKAVTARTRVARELNIATGSTTRAKTPPKKSKTAAKGVPQEEVQKEIPKDIQKETKAAALPKPAQKPTVATAAAIPPPAAKTPPAPIAEPALTTPPAPPAAPETSAGAVPAAAKTTPPVPSAVPTPAAKARPKPAPKAPKPPPLQTDGWKNPFSLTPAPEAPSSPALPQSPVETKKLPGTAVAPAPTKPPATKSLKTAAIADTVTDAGGPTGKAAGTGTASTATSTLATEWRVQFAAYRSAEDADRALATLNRTVGAAIGRTPRIIDVADLGDRGVFHRLQAGPLDGSDAAEKLCTLVQAVLPQQGCVPVQIRNR
ncbi:MAG: hypothetical protein ACI9JL_001377 [Paracoccaceae bacterium]|jgi:hypothetical protein